MFKDVMLFFSKANPNLAGVISTMDQILKELSINAANTNYSLSIHAAVKKGKYLLEKYDDLMKNESEIHWIPTSTFSHLSYMLIAD